MLPDLFKSPSAVARITWAKSTMVKTLCSRLPYNWKHFTHGEYDGYRHCLA